MGLTRAASRGGFGGWGILLVLALAALAGPAWAQNLDPPNLRPVGVLSLLDIDGDGAADGSVDTDGDGLPDNWERGGTEPESGLAGNLEVDRLVQVPTPAAVRSTSTPRFIFSRPSVTTEADTADTDGDGLSDFIEVFGLKFIDDNNNGILDFLFDDADGDGVWDANETIDPISEWLDLNNDGLPSIGERPLVNDLTVDPEDTDFDGFIFTDPVNADTDGDGTDDGDDRDPLVNQATVAASLAGGFDRLFAPGPGDEDFDNDGLGDGSDFGNDLTGIVDFPSDLYDRMSAYRPDRVSGCGAPTIPESMIEDLLADDWNGDGLYQLTDVRSFRRNINRVAADAETCLEEHFGDRFAELFLVGDDRLFGEDPTVSATVACQAPSEQTGGACTSPSTYAARQPGLGWQELLLPVERSDPFLPDIRVWTILYAWRVPGFDIDGNGYIGSPENTFSLDEVHAVPMPLTPFSFVPFCGPVGVLAPFVTLLALTAVRLTRPNGRYRVRR